MHKEKHHNLYSSPNIIRMIKSRMMKWVGHVALMGEGWITYKVLVTQPEGKWQFGRPNYRWKGNVTVVLRLIVREDVDWIHVTQDRKQWWALVNMVMNLCVL